jgi:curved DNA-binding protein CbpA
VDDLYALLGIPRDADDAAIRRAYRRASKAAHPDGGGARKDFEMLTLARDCLLDPERRQRYDATGDAGKTEIDNLDAAALQHAMSALGNVIGLVESMGRDPLGADIYEKAVEELSRKAKEVKQQIETVRKIADKFRALAACSRARDGVDRIAPMFEANARAAEEGVRQNEGLKRQIERAIDILKAHEFRPDKKVQAARQPSYNQAGSVRFRIG